MREAFGSRHYDAIVIGSGAGGLTVASLLAKLEKKRVLVVERHRKLGGYTHSFSRLGKFNWNVGLHLVGQMGTGQKLRQIVDQVSDGTLDWVKLSDPSMYFVYPWVKFPFRADRTAYQKSLTDLFPAERASIDRYFTDLHAASSWMERRYISGLLPGRGRANSKISKYAQPPLALENTSNHMDRLGLSSRLKSLLDSQWCNYGSPIDRSLFGVHSMFVNHYLDGVFYPIGGGQEFSRAILPIIERHGGDAVLNHEVKEILVDDSGAYGVSCTTAGSTEESQFTAPIVISNVGATNTYQRLLSKIRFPFESSLARLNESSVSGIVLYIGFKQSPSTIGLNGEFYWIFGSEDHVENFRLMNRFDDAPPPSFGVSFSSLVDPPKGAHTAQVIYPIQAKCFPNELASSFGQRSVDYVNFKKRLESRILSQLEKHFPGIGSIIEYTELGTPRSFERFTGHHAGQMYGLPMNRKRFDSTWLRSTTPVPNLYLTGVDVTGCGFAGAVMSGVICFAEIAGIGSLSRVTKPTRAQAPN